MPDNITKIIFQNYSSSHMLRTNMEDIHGRWYQDNGKTWGEPTYELWAKHGKGEMCMEGYFIYTGTSGAAEYEFDDKDTLIRLWFSNPLIGENTFDVKLWGPKKDQYRWE